MSNERRLDDVDRRIVAELAADGRMPNNALAERVGVAPSTCLARVRALQQSGAIRGFHADIDPAALGLPLQAVIKVRLGSHNRDHVKRFTAALPQIPGVLQVFHVAGEDDYLIHVAADSSEGLRDLVLEHLNVHPVVRHTETHLVFERFLGRGLGSGPQESVSPRPGPPPG